MVRTTRSTAKREAPPPSTETPPPSNDVTPPKQERKERAASTSRAPRLRQQQQAAGSGKKGYRLTFDSPQERRARSERRKGNKDKDKGEEEEAEEAENVAPYRDEGALGSMAPLVNEINKMTAVERYFLKGKLPVMNRKRTKRTKKDRRGDRGQESHENEQEEQENSREDCEEEEKGEAGAFIASCDLGVIKEYLKKSQAALARDVETSWSKRFPKWNLLLAANFNLLIHGIGTRHAVLRAFAECELIHESNTIVELEAFKPDASVRTLLAALKSVVGGKMQKAQSYLEAAEEIVAKANDNDNRGIVLVIHHIDASNFRDPAAQEILATLAESSSIRIVASVCHLNAMLLWDTAIFGRFRWAHDTVNTWEMGEEELYAGNSALLDLHSTAAKATHSMASLEAFWKSLTDASRKILHAIFSLVFLPRGGVEGGERVQTTRVAGKAEKEKTTKSIGFYSLFKYSADNFWVSTDASLRQHLTEFLDHRLVRIRRHNDGTERIYAAVDRQLINAFFDKKDMSLASVEDVPEDA